MAFSQNQVIIINELDPRFSVPNINGASGAIVASGGVTTIAAGTPTKGTDATAASWTGAVLPMVDGDGTTSQRFTGIAKSDSNDTASAAGTVELWLPLPGLVYAAAAKIASNANTIALIQGLYGKRVVFDLTASLWTVDTAAADAAANMLVIVGGNPTTSQIWFTYKTTGTVIGQIA